LTDDEWGLVEPLIPPIACAAFTLAMSWYLVRPDERDIGNLGARRRDHHGPCDGKTGSKSLS
jgi:hypothetical protein